MSQTEKGVLIFDEWFNAMEDIKVTDFKRLVYAMFRLQRFGEEPPEFEGKARVAASIIFPMIRRRKELAEYGSIGAAKRLSRSEGASKEASGEASREASSRDESPLEAIEEKREEKKRRAYSPRSTAAGEVGRASRTAQSRGGKAAKSNKSEADEEWDEFFDLAVARSLGEYLK